MTDAAHELITRADPERWLAVTYASRHARPALAALFALDISLGRVVASTSEPMIGAMRLAWWREALERLHLPPVPGEPVLQALAAQPAWQGPDMAAALAAMVGGWLALIEVDPLDAAAIQTHASERGERLFELAGVALGLDADMAVIRRLGRGWALIDLASRLTQARARKEAITLAADALSARAGPLPFRARPLVALAALARGDAATGLRRRRVGSPGRQLRMLMALLIGK